MRSPPRSRLLWADLLKILAIAAVILIHAAAPLLPEYSETTAAQWWIGNFYDSLARWCIPVFFMLSGALLLGRADSQSPLRFLVRRVGRIAIPFLLWSGIYFVWNKEVNGQALSYGAFPGSILREPSYYHLWFLYILGGLYLLAPLLSVYLGAASRQNIAWFLVLWFVFGSLLPTLQTLRGAELSSTLPAAETVFRYVGLFALGYLLRPVRCGWRGMMVLLTLFLLAVACTATGTWFLTTHHNGGGFAGALYEYYAPNVLIMAVSLYLLVKSIHLPPLLQRLPRPRRLIGFAATCALGIYLSHALVIAVLKQGKAGVRLEFTTLSPIIGVPLFALVVFGVSFALTALIRAIPGLRQLLT